MTAANTLDRAVAAPGGSALDALAAKANREHALALQSGQAMIHHAVRSGEALIQAQRHVDGDWRRWLADNFAGHYRTASTYVRLAAYQEHLDLNGAEVGIRDALYALRGLPATGVTVRRALPDELREEVLNMHREGKSQRAIAKALGVSRPTVHRWVDPVSARKRDADNQRRRYRARRQEREALRRQERDRAARRVGGSVAEAYTTTRKAAEAYQRALGQATNREAKAALRLALGHLYRAEDEIVRALGISA